MRPDEGGTPSCIDPILVARDIYHHVSKMPHNQLPPSPEYVTELAEALIRVRRLAAAFIDT